MLHRWPRNRNIEVRGCARLVEVISKEEIGDEEVRAGVDAPSSRHRHRLWVTREPASGRFVPRRRVSGGAAGESVAYPVHESGTGCEDFVGRRLVGR
jgi:hypothetical protein